MEIREDESCSVTDIRKEINAWETFVFSRSFVPDHLSELGSLPEPSTGLVRFC